MSARWAQAITAALLLTAGSALAADPPANEGDLFRTGAEALRRGEYAAAIEAFEALADKGFVHPDASYDRGLAYVMRVKARAERPGDLGRAAAAFEEALLLRPSDEDADHALDLVRAEVTRRRARAGQSSVVARPTLDRLVVGLASEDVWAGLAIASAIVFALGLVLRKKPSGPLHVAGAVMWPTALVAVIALAPLAWGARWLRLHTRPGVVVASEVVLVNASGQSLGIDAVPEAASVELGASTGDLVHVRWGAVEGYAPSSAIRVLSQGR